MRWGPRCTHCPGDLEEAELLQGDQVMQALLEEEEVELFTVGESDGEEEADGAEQAEEEEGIAEEQVQQAFLEEEEVELLMDGRSNEEEEADCEQQAEEEEEEESSPSTESLYDDDLNSLPEFTSGE